MGTEIRRDDRMRGKALAIIGIALLFVWSAELADCQATRTYSDVKSTSFPTGQTLDIDPLLTKTLEFGMKNSLDLAGNTILSVYVKEAETNANVSGVSANIIYSVRSEDHTYRMTDSARVREGFCQFDLGAWVGTVSLTVTDSSGVYSTRSEPSFSVARGQNTRTVYVTRVGAESPFDWQKYLPHIVAGVIGVSFAVGLCCYYKKKKGAVAENAKNK